MAADHIVSSVLMMNLRSATVMQVLPVTLPTTALILTTTWRTTWQLVSAQLLVVLLLWTDGEAQQRPCWTTTLDMSDRELTQKIQMVLRYRSGGVMYLAFHLAPVLECLSLAWPQ